MSNGLRLVALAQVLLNQHLCSEDTQEFRDVGNF